MVSQSVPTDASARWSIYTDTFFAAASVIVSVDNLLMMTAIWAKTGKLQVRYAPSKILLFQKKDTRDQILFTVVSMYF